jgi:SAM-dependent methyltransferase
MALAAEERVPLCPITGEPAKRRVQWLYPKTLTLLWRYSFGVDVARFVRGIERFGLWESPVGLMFFDPLIAGDGEFYHTFYRRIDAHERLSGGRVMRPEFVAAAAFVTPGMAVLDVGCGEGGFQPYVPSAQYCGLDTNFGGKRPLVLAETIEEHAKRLPAHYDVVCSFQVAEHVTDPLAFVRAMRDALKPGGLLLLGVPFWPTPLTAIPNFVLNAPPHHLTWWSEQALRALCDKLGLECREIRPVPVGTHSRIIHWMARFAPRHRGERYFRTAWSWHLGLLWSYLAGSIADRLLTVPPDAPVSEILLIARKP